MRILRIIKLVSIVSVLLSFDAHASDNSSNIPQGVLDYCNSALKDVESGGQQRQVDLAWCYENGLGVPLDLKKSVELLEKATSWNIDAQVRLGLMYERGKGVAKDTSKAVFWYQKAADQGYITGQIYLGMMYVKGEGVEKNTDKAEELYSKAIAQEKKSYTDSNGNSFNTYISDPEKFLEWKKAKENYYSEKNLQFVGDFTHIDHIDESCEGYIVDLWKNKKSLVGYLRHYNGQCWDPTTNIIDSVGFKPSTGELSFKAKLYGATCINFIGGRCKYSKDIVIFKGKLKADNLDGEITWYSLDLKKNIRSETINLVRAQDSDDYDKSPASYEMFAKSWREVFEPLWNNSK